MKRIQYRVTYADPAITADEIITVSARSINSGFTKALKRAKETLGNGTEREISRIEFWMVTQF